MMSLEYFNFINSIKSEVTKEIYEYNLKIFMKFCNIERFLSSLRQYPNPQNEYKTFDFVERKWSSSNSISTRLNAIYHFYDMNDIAFKQKEN